MEEVIALVAVLVTLFTFLVGLVGGISVMEKRKAATRWKVAFCGVWVAVWFAFFSELSAALPQVYTWGDYSPVK